MKNIKLNKPIIYQTFIYKTLIISLEKKVRDSSYIPSIRLIRKKKKISHRPSHTINTINITFLYKLIYNLMIIINFIVTYFHY